MFTDVLKEVTGALDRRFFLNVFLPCLIFWGLLVVTWFAGHGELSNVVRNWSEQETSIQVLQAIGLLSWVILFSNVIASNSTAILRFYEGYWDFPFGALLKKRGERWHLRKLEDLNSKKEEDPYVYEEIY